MKPLAPLLALLVLPGAARAQGAVVSDAPQAVAVTIYRDGPVETARLRYAPPQEGLALVTETRRLDLPAGRSVVKFRGVAERIIPQTATLEGLKAQVAERNADYDLLSPAALMVKSVGRTVRIVRTDPATGRVTERPAVVRAAGDGVVLEIDGKLEALGCAGLPERIVFDDVPPSLAADPTFSMVVESEKGGPQDVRLSYLATGLSWSADYVATLSADGRSIDLFGWITLANMSGARFGEAPTQVVAGDLSRDDGTRPIDPPWASAPRLCWASGVAPSGGPPIPPLPVPRVERRLEAVEEVVVTGMARQSDLGDYKLYSLPEATSIAARQIKQVAFLHQPRVAVQRVYAFDYDGGDEAEPARVLLRLDNRVAEGLGKPLPAGSVAVMEPAAGGGTILAGEDRLERDLPVGLKGDLEIGQAIDVTVEPRIVEEKHVDGRERRTVEVEILNRKPHPVRVEYRHRMAGQGRLVAGPRPQEASAGDLLWRLDLPASSRKVLRYAVAN